MPNRNDKQNSTAKSRARKLYDNLLTKHNGCILMDDETYVKMDFKQIPGQCYYASKIRGNVSDKYKYVMTDKFSKKLMIWQALCSCGNKSPIHVCLGTMKSSEYVKCCLSRIKRLIKAHRSTSVLFWPDLATIHYSKDAQKFYDDNGVMLVPKMMNPPNCPELRPIEKYWAIIKKKLKLSGKTVKSATDLKNKWDYAAKTYKNHSVQKLMGGIKKKVKIFCKTEFFFVFSLLICNLYSLNFSEIY